jgi:putative ABC transport system permease protein
MECEDSDFEGVNGLHIVCKLPLKLHFMRAWLNILYESVAFAFHALMVNKLRAFLSLLGISIGIFSIILVYAVVDSLEANIRSSVNSLGNNVVYVQKWGWGGGGEYPWWKYLKRPEPSYEDYRKLTQRFDKAEALVFGMSMNGTAKYKNNSVERVGVLGATHDYYRVWEFDLSEGRYLTELESNSGPNVAVIGADIAEGLFPNLNAEGKKFSVLGRKFTVIGVFERVGSSLVGQSQDELILIPAATMRKMVNPDRLQGNMIMAKAKPSVPMDEFKSELKGALRTIRRLKPKVDDDFSLNEISVIAQGIDQLFGVLGLAGTVIGIFSILVGGFGIANIMFVSVKERTNQIGIQKALGARSGFILMQFLAESILLSILGGLLGLAIVFSLLPLVTDWFGFEVFMSSNNVIIALFISTVVGLISGIIPAIMASKMDPVEAIRSGI